MYMEREPVKSNKIRVEYPQRSNKYANFKLFKLIKCALTYYWLEIAGSQQLHGNIRRHIRFIE
jgi:hypothetical protein